MPMPNVLFEEYLYFFEVWIDYLGAPKTVDSYALEVEFFDSLWRVFGKEFFEEL